MGWDGYEVQKAGIAQLGEERGYDQGLYDEEGSGEGEGEAVHPNSPLVEHGSV